MERLLADADARSFQCDGTSVTNFIEKKLHRRGRGATRRAADLAAASREGDFRALEGLRHLREALRGREGSRAREDERRPAAPPGEERAGDGRPARLGAEVAPDAEPKSKSARR
ncbi:MAG: hypothetical protein U0324_28365 [Polyangiales bacterium]